MMKRFNYFLLVILILVTGCTKPGSQAPSSAPAFQAGKDYEVLSQSSIVPVQGPQPNVKVVEFFSFGCPACYALEPKLEAWLKKKAAYIEFERIPVLFEPNWQPLSRVFYTAKYLGVASQLTPVLFNALHVGQKDLSDPQTVEKIFLQQGISKQAFESAYNFSVGINAQIMRSSALVQTYGIVEIPTFVINDLYKVNPSMAHGDRLFQVIDYLAQSVYQGNG